MTPTHTVVGALLLSSLASGWAQSPDSNAIGPPGCAMSVDMRSRMQAHMQAMQSLRERMNAAGSASERQSLMQEHLRLMDDSMALMHQAMQPHRAEPGARMPMHDPGAAPRPGGAGGPAPMR